MAPFIFAHHPLCTFYTKDIVKTKKFILCKGCLLTYLPFIIGTFFGLVMVTILKPTIPIIITSWEFLFCWSTIIVIFFMIKNKFFIHKLKDYLRISVFFLSGMIFAILLMFQEWSSIIIAYMLANIFIIVIFIFRYKSFNKTCSLCPEMPFRGRCSGFAPYISFIEDIEELL